MLSMNFHIELESEFNTLFTSLGLAAVVVLPEKGSKDFAPSTLGEIFSPSSSSDMPSPFLKSGNHCVFPLE